MKKKSNKQELIEENARLKQELLMAKAYDIMAMSGAVRSLHQMKKMNFMASGVIFTITSLRGEVIVGPVVVVDGFSALTIDSISSEVRSSHAQRIADNTLFTEK